VYQFSKAISVINIPATAVAPYFEF